MNIRHTTSYLIVTILYFFVLTGVLFGQAAPPTAPDYLNINNSPRSLALGEATAALEGYAGAGFINPATVGMQDIIQVSTDISSLPGEPLRLQNPYFMDDLWNATRSAAYRAGRFAAEFRWKTHSFTQDHGNVEDQRYGEALSGSVAYSLTGHLRVGAGIKYMYWRDSRETNLSNDHTANAHNFSVDLGLLYHQRYEMNAISLNTSYGWSLTDFGPTFSIDAIRQVGNQQIDYGLPMKMRLGTTIEAELNRSWNGRPLASLSLLGQFSKTLARRDDSGDPHGPFRALFSSWGSYTPPGGGEVTLGEQFFSHGGIELSLADLLYARMGYVNRPTYAFDIASYGLGIDFYYLAVDMTRLKPADTISSIGRPYTAWKVTARIPMGTGDESNFWPDLLNKLFK